MCHYEGEVIEVNISMVEITLLKLEACCCLFAGGVIILWPLRIGIRVYDWVGRGYIDDNLGEGGELYDGFQ